MLLGRQRSSSAVAAVTAALALALALAVTPAAHGAWSSPFYIGDGRAPQYLGPVGTGGDVVVFAWGACERVVHFSCSGDQRLLARTRSISSGELGRVLPVSAEGVGATDFRLAVAPDGDAVFVWSQRDGERARRMTAGVLGPIIDVAPAGSGGFQPAIGPGGDAVLAWITGNFIAGKHIRARTLSPASVLGPALEIPTPGQGTGVSGVGIGAGGDVVVAWDDQGCRCRPATGKAHVRRLLVRSGSPASGRVGPIAEPWTASRPGRVERAIDPSVSVDGDGDALVQWRYSPRGGDDSDRVWARTFAASGTLGRATITAPTGATAMAPSGRAATIWERGHSLLARTISPAGRVGRAVVLGRVADDGQSTIAISPAGTAVVAWERSDGLMTRSLSPRGEPGPLVRLAPAGDDPNPRIPSFEELAAAAGPANVVAWQRQARWMPEAAVDIAPTGP